ncbi:MAG TPA: hypothetical protein VFA53_12225 [Xanthobacteraceae bacterium]|nr:hypothetical protein [Xanthobacteraceae bacterium]
MAGISHYLAGEAFDAATIRILDEAYEKARRLLHDRGQPAVVQEIIAQRIAEIARTGERDPAEIAERALQAAGLVSKP